MACAFCGKSSLTLFVREILSLDISHPAGRVLRSRRSYLPLRSFNSKFSSAAVATNANDGNIKSHGIDEFYLPFALDSTPGLKGRHDRSVLPVTPSQSRPHHHQHHQHDATGPRPLGASEAFDIQPSIRIENTHYDFTSSSVSSANTPVSQTSTKQSVPPRSPIAQEIQGYKRDDQRLRRTNSSLKRSYSKEDHPATFDKVDGNPAPSSKAHPSSNPSRTQIRTALKSSPESEKVRHREHWQIQKEALKRKFGDENWAPRKKLSPDAIDGIRALHIKDPQTFKTAVLADRFKVSPEAIRRILKSKWKPTPEEEESRRARWDKRGEKIWTSLVQQGIHAPKKWREMGIGKGVRRRASRAKTSAFEADAGRIAPPRIPSIAARIM